MPRAHFALRTEPSSTCAHSSARWNAQVRTRWRTWNKSMHVDILQPHGFRHVFVAQWRCAFVRCIDWPFIGHVHRAELGNVASCFLVCVSACLLTELRCHFCVRPAAGSFVQGQHVMYSCVKSVNGHRASVEIEPRTSRTLSEKIIPLDQAAAWRC